MMSESCCLATQTLPREELHFESEDIFNIKIYKELNKYRHQ